MGGIINTYAIVLFTYFIENILFLSVSEVLFIVDILKYIFLIKSAIFVRLNLI